MAEAITLLQVVVLVLVAAFFVEVVWPPVDRGWARIVAWWHTDAPPPKVVDISTWQEHRPDAWTGEGGVRW